MLEQNIASASTTPEIGAPPQAGTETPLRSSFTLRKSIVCVGLIVITLSFCQSHLGGATNSEQFESQNVAPQIDPYLQERNRSTAREQQELHRTRVSLTDAMGDDVHDATITQTAQEGAGKKAAALDESSEEIPTNVVLAGVFLLAVILALRRFAPGVFKRQPDPWAPNASAAKAFAAKVRAEEEAFAEFLVVFQKGPTTPAPASTPDCGNLTFSRRVAPLLAAQRSLILNIDREADDAARLRLLTSLRDQVSSLKDLSGVPELLPVWQLSSAMEGLLKQLIDKPKSVLPSTLRTVARGVELLNELCAADLKPDLLSARPIKLLAVDDDLVSRNALSLALKKALNEPDLAANAEAALALAARQTYDVIFLDVQMPGLDGFELCSRIHETAANRTTPIVFVAGQSDFDARAQSTLCGGQDLMAKPFLTFEVTVKALTLGLRGRLRGNVVMVDAPNDAPSSLQIRGLGSDEQPSPELPAATFCLSEPHTATGTTGEEAGDDTRETPSRPRISAPRPDVQTLIASLDSPEELADLFSSRAATYIAPMRELLDALFQTADETERQDMLAEIYIRVHSFAPKEYLAAATHPAMRLSSALEGLLRKLLEDTKHSTMSTLVTLVSGLDLLNDLCVARLTSDLDDPPIQLLVVDDDLVARRAITCALQMTFGRPEAAENGEAALALIVKKQFDVIFLDVQMPGIDGLTLCSKIRETALNATTPVVFVTANDDFNARTQMSQSGGNDFMGKPFLNSEISVKALTFALRTRLQNLATANAVSPDAAVEFLT